jgi:hypothetical protein
MGWPPGGGVRVMESQARIPAWLKKAAAGPKDSCETLKHSTGSPGPMPSTALARQELLARNEAILRAKVLVELDRGARFLEHRVQRMFTGFTGMLLNPVAGAAFRAVGRDEIVVRAQRQLDALIAAARTHGERPEAIFDGHLTAYLQHDEAWARANRHHPRHAELEGLLREVYVARVEPVSLLLHRGLGDTYNDLVRSVFPDRASAARLLEREFVYADRILGMAEREQGLLGCPPLVRREVFGVLRDTYRWYQGCVQANLDEVYGRQPLVRP